MNSAAQSSAEWIVEAPWSGGILPLADFGPWPIPAKFGSFYTTPVANTCFATVGGANAKSQPIGYYAANLVQILMVGSNGATKASPSAPPSSPTDGNFTVTWLNAGP
jgi:hypothetical protein